MSLEQSTALVPKGNKELLYTSSGHCSATGRRELHQPRCEFQRSINNSSHFLII